MLTRACLLWRTPDDDATFSHLMFDSKNQRSVIKAFIKDPSVGKTLVCGVELKLIFIILKTVHVQHY